MLPVSHPKSAFRVSGNHQMVPPGCSWEALSFSARVTWCLSRMVLRAHFSLSDVTVGTVGHLCAVSRMESSPGQKGPFLSAGDSQYPILWQVGCVCSGASWEPLSDSPLGHILRNWNIFTLQKA